jgi:hypothetical protein
MSPASGATAMLSTLQAENKGQLVQVKHLMLIQIIDHSPSISRVEQRLSVLLPIQYYSSV